MDTPSFVPAGYNAVMPALAISGAAAAIEWYKNVFGAMVQLILKDDKGAVVHGEITIGQSVVMVSEENPEYNKSPKTLGGNSIHLMTYVQNVDAVLTQAVQLGAKLLMPAADQFYGDRAGRIEDPFGYIWIVATRIKEVSAADMQKMVDEMSNS